MRLASAVLLVTAPVAGTAVQHACLPPCGVANHTYVKYSPADGQMMVGNGKQCAVRAIDREGLAACLGGVHLIILGGSQTWHVTRTILQAAIGGRASRALGCDVLYSVASDIAWTDVEDDRRGNRTKEAGPDLSISGRCVDQEADDDHNNTSVFLSADRPAEVIRLRARMRHAARAPAARITFLRSNFPSRAREILEGHVLHSLREASASGLRPVLYVDLGGVWYRHCIVHGWCKGRAELAAVREGYLRDRSRDTAWAAMRDIFSNEMKSFVASLDRACAAPASGLPSAQAAAPTAAGRMPHCLVGSAHKATGSVELFLQGLRPIADEQLRHLVAQRRVHLVDNEAFPKSAVTVEKAEEHWSHVMNVWIASNMLAPVCHGALAATGAARASASCAGNGTVRVQFSPECFKAHLCEQWVERHNGTHDGSVGGRGLAAGRRARRRWCTVGWKDLFSRPLDCRWQRQVQLN